MSKGKQSKKREKINPLLPVAIIVIVLAVVVVFVKPSLTNNNKSEDGTAVTADNIITTQANGDIVIQKADITKEASFYEFEISGISMGLFAVKASDGTIRTALNTCQVCNGSPYAYFEQKDDVFECQNCGNQFSLDMIGNERGGCNPVPVGDEERTEDDTTIVIPSSYLQDNSVRFENWKKF